MRLGIHVEGHHLMTGIDAAGQEDARMTAVQTGRPEEVLRRAVAVAVAPGSVQTGLACLQPLQRIVHHLIGLARRTVHIDQELLTLVHEPLTRAGGSQIVLRRVTDGLRRAVGHVDHRTVGSTHHGLCPSVLVPVVGDDILFVVLEVGHVRPQVNPPQFLSVQLIYLYDKVLALIARLLVTRCCPALVVELDQDLQFSVAIDISTTGIVGHVGRFQVAVIGRDLQPVLRPDGGRLRVLPLLTVHHGGHRVRTALGAPVGIQKIGCLEWNVGIDLRAVPIDVIRHIVILLGQYAPGAIHPFARLHSHQSTIQHVRLPLCHGRHDGHTEQYDHNQVFLHHSLLAFNGFYPLQLMAQK